jgi:HEAT repeats
MSSMRWAPALVVISLAASSMCEPVRAQDIPRNEPDAPPTAAPVVTFNKDGRIIISAERPLLSEVLAELSAGANIPIVVADALAEESVAIKLREVTLEQAFGQILAPYDAFYLYSASGKSDGAISTIWVYPRGEGRSLQPVAPAQGASTKELDRALEDPDPNLRYQAYEAIIGRQGARALPTLHKALADDSEVVRFAALHAAIDAGLEIPTSELSALVSSDPSRDVRLLALEGVGSRPEAEALVAGLQDDPDREVGAQAKETLERLRAAAKKAPR